jgi:hypothetical protein
MSVRRYVISAALFTVFFSVTMTRGTDWSPWFIGAIFAAVFTVAAPFILRSDQDDD